VQTKYTHTKTSSDDFAAQKADEIALEDRHTRRAQQ
jgi:hypothetical protein